MKKKLLLVLQFIAVLLLSTIVAYGQKEKLTGIVSGKDGPLTGATVAVDSLMTLTDHQGEFSISILPGRYTLSITHSGYKKIIHKIEVRTGKHVSFAFNMIPDELIGDVIIVGSRSLVQRSNLATPVPVDVISSKQLLQTSQVSLTQMLQFTVPSFNASRQLAHEPVTLRGLDPDQTLILVNNKRYHNLSFMNWGGVRGILGRGAVSNDINSIPYAAIETIEILRDGASAQYGSDAIAGVINIRLKKATNKTTIDVHAGRFYEEDGESVRVGINRGINFLKNGFLNFAGTFRFQQPTYRGGTYKGTVYNNNTVTDDSLVAARNFNRRNLSNAGSSAQIGFNSSMNGGYTFNKRTEFFWTAGMNDRQTVFSNNHAFPKNANRVNLQLFPDGFKSKPIIHSTDVWGIAGIKGKTKTNWNWEYSSNYGNNWGRYSIQETNNASQAFTLGEDAPTSFYTGSLSYGQLINNMQFTKSLFDESKKMLNLTFGCEWRLEHFRIREGEEGAWKNYNPSGNKQGGSGGLVFSPQDAARQSRNVIAAYIEAEKEYKKRLLIAVASRYEYYTDFGGNLSGKLAARYKLNKLFSLRGSVSNGFRAPALQQRYWSFTRISYATINGVNEPVTLGIFRNNSEVAKAVGIPSLQAERSVNITAGITALVTPAIHLTIDAYWIQITDRIVLSGVFDTTKNSGLKELLVNITDVNQLQFLTNAINTRTKGIDVVLNMNKKIGEADLLVNVGANFTKTRLFGKIKKAGNLPDDEVNGNTLFSREERGKLENGQPANKIILSVEYKKNRIGLLLRNTKFGKTAILSSNQFTNADEYFGSKILTDFSLNYHPSSRLTITAGANNLFNIYPAPLRDPRNTGEGFFIYGQEAAPFGFNGGYYFVGMEIRLN